MANTLIPIQTYTLTSATASVTFSNIPQNYTDLKIVCSMRSARVDTDDSIALEFNNVSTNLSIRRILGTGSAASSANTTSIPIRVPADNVASNTFGNTEITIPNYTASQNKSVSIDNVTEANATLTFAELVAGLWSNAAAITSIKFTSQNSQNFMAGSTFTLYGVSNGVKATGGTLTVAGGYAYHTFTSTGSFLPNQRIKNAEVLVVAGGASGGSVAGGGGGAGGVVYSSSQTLNAGNSYTALVGAGGASVTGVYSSGATQGLSGNDSVFSSNISKGGGGGGGYNTGAGSNGTAGGNGGGGGGGGAGGGTGGSALNNFAGGNGAGAAGGGGGGAGVVGSAAPSSQNGGNGGNGTTAYTVWHTVTSTGVFSGGVYYIAGGGSGGADTTSGIAGIGGGGKGGAGGNVAGAAATANTGGGGGGAGGTGPVASGAGGSGLIIVRYPLS
jgi:hypothetical protein